MDGAAKAATRPEQTGSHSFRFTTGSNRSSVSKNRFRCRKDKGYRRALEVIRELIGQIEVPEVMRDLIDINHNYVDQEEHFGEALFVHRKGAIRVSAGQKGSIPGSMGTPSYVIEGRGIEQAFFSCSHGAGRVMSRSEATRKITRKDYVQSVAGVVCKLSRVA